MVAYSLECVDCDLAFRTRAQWLEHLLQPLHSQCRSADVKWSFENGKLRKCVIVVYSATPVSLVASELLEFFSCGGQRIVTDFVTVAHKPKLAILCYESSKVAVNVYLAVGGPQVRICNQLVEIKKGADFLCLEWEELISSVWSQGHDEGATGTAVENLCKISVPDVTSSSTLTPRKFGVSLKTSAVVATNIDDKVVEDFQRIRDYVEVSQEDYQRIVRVFDVLKVTFQRKISSFEELHFYRAWGFKLKFNSKGDVAKPCMSLRFNDLEKDTDALRIFKQMKNHGGDRIDRMFVKHFNVDTKLFKLFRLFWHAKFGIPTSFSLHFSLTHDGSNFDVKSGEIHDLEAETFRLLRYLLAFDPRARSLLSLVRYFEITNGVHLEMMQVDGSGPSLHINPNVPLSASELLLVFFLCHRKLIPTPGDVLKVCAAKSPRLIHGSPVGFIQNGKYVSYWFSEHGLWSLPKKGSVAFVLSILELARSYFQFCSELADKNWILNSRDGDILFLSSTNESSANLAKCQLSSDEKQRLKVLLSDLSSRSGKNSGVIISHPLVSQACFQFKDDVANYICPVFQLCASNLTNLTAQLNNRMPEQNDVTEKVEDEQKMDLLKVLDLGASAREQILEGRDKQLSPSESRKSSNHVYVSAEADFFLVPLEKD